MWCYKTEKIIYGKEDIKKDCKYCHKTDRKSFDSAYGFYCYIKHEKRNMNRCRTCYFGNKIEI